MRLTDKSGAVFRLSGKRAGELSGPAGLPRLSFRGFQRSGHNGGALLMTSSALSIVICTHNPRPDHFGRTLAGLRAQTLPFDLWELLIIDNASAPEMAPRPDLSWHPRARLLHEAKLGLTHARLRGIQEAAGDLLVFVDDDNVLDPDYLETAQRIANEIPFLGSWSGQCRPEFEKPPPDWTRRYWGNLVIRQFDKDVWSNLPRLSETIPCGAGLCVRLQVAQRYLHLHESGERPMLLDRVGDSLFSGGDNDLAACACDLGLGVGLIAALKLTHLIPPERVTEQYLVRLMEGIYCSGVVLAYLRSSKTELASYRIRWREYLRALAIKGVHRKMQFAHLRGRRHGLQIVAALKNAALENVS
jgi:glycosyltransferase involved in cell wall biosynthesis